MKTLSLIALIERAGTAVATLLDPKTLSPVGDEVSCTIPVQILEGDTLFAQQVEAACYAEEVVRQQLGLSLSTGFEELDAAALARIDSERTVAVVKPAASKVAELEVGRVMPPPFPVSVRTANPVQSANAAAMKLRRRHSISGRVEIVGKTTVANGWALRNPGKVAMMVEDDLALLCQQRGRQ